MPPIERTTSAPDADRGPKAARCAHWLVTVIFAAGLVLRVLTQVAYRPALLYIDSARYLAGPAWSRKATGSCSGFSTRSADLRW